MNLTTLLSSNNWSIFSVRAVLTTVIHQLRLLVTSEENLGITTTNILHSEKSRASDRPKNRTDGGRRGSSRVSDRPENRTDGGRRGSTSRVADRPENRTDGGRRGNTDDDSILFPETPNQTPNFHALLIGIDFYFPHELEGGSYKNLRGCVRDINHVETYLKNTFNLTSDQIIKLTATASDNPKQPKESPEFLPTYENIVAKFKEVTAKAKPQDQVYIHYSGHGGQAKTIFTDIKGISGIDQGLVPTDIGQPNSRYLRDLEFAQLLEEMVNKKLVVTLVLDSCHSGGATRGGEDKIRAGGFIDMTPRRTNSLVAPIQELTKNWQNLTANSRNLTVANGLLPQPKGYTLIAACRDNEFAYEDVFEGTERNGALTYFLLKNLRKFGTEIAVEELFNSISNFVHNRFERQTPMLIGQTKQTFFGGQSVVSRPTPTVMDVDITKNRVKIQAGQANGIKKGAEFDIFRFTTRDFQDSQNLIATVKVVELGASDCWAEVTELHNIRTINNNLSEGMIEIGSPAIYLGPGVKQIRKVCVLFPDPLPQIPGVNVALLPNILAAKKEQIEGHRWIEFCSETEIDVDYFVSLNAAGEYWVLDALKQPIKNIIFPIKADDPEASEKLINRLIHLAKYQTIWDLDNEEYSAPLNGKLKLELGTSVKREFVPLETDNNIYELEEGERVFLRIHNLSNQTLNITALILQEDLSIVKFYPKAVPYEVLEPGKYKDTRFDLELPKNYQEGVDIVKVFATVDGTNFELLELPVLDQSRRGFGNQQPTNKLEELLAAVVDEDSPQRNIKVVTDASEEWTTEKVVLVVKK
ncbi:MULTISPECIES: caspase family protein [Okeania]|uniref:Caspase family protein n=1 Tax=Okeania hirsuta TaxID=1458930 RepID=A0A3N6PLY3_9CYAN|nr:MULTISPECIES: caspase family protein [Okeania]NES88689.1 caspase family protein [Okeania sp. SIO2B9]RQH29816.1 caspase family protein [Okeania hirsuta]